MLNRLLIASAMLVLLSMHPLQAQQPGALTFASNCAACHGADGRGGEHAPNIATAPEVQHLADTDLAGIIRNGISGAGMPAFASWKQSQVDEVVSYLRILQGRGNIIQLPGDAHQGELLFFGKAHCADCHMVHGKGGVLGSELSYYGADAKPEQIRAILLDPEANLSPGQKATTVVTNTGEKVTGMLRLKNNFSLSLQTADGAFHFFSRPELSQVDYGTRSLMPKSVLTENEVNDLISYLLRTGSENGKHSPAEKSDDDDN